MPVSPTQLELLLAAAMPDQHQVPTAAHTGQIRTPGLLDCAGTHLPPPLEQLFLFLGPRLEGRTLCQLPRLPAAVGLAVGTGTTGEAAGPVCMCVYVCECHSTLVVAAMSQHC